MQELVGKAAETEAPGWLGVRELGSQLWRNFVGKTAQMVDAGNGADECFRFGSRSALVPNLGFKFASGSAFGADLDVKFAWKCRIWVSTWAHVARGPDLDVKYGSRGDVGPDLGFKVGSRNALGLDLGFKFGLRNALVSDFIFKVGSKVLLGRIWVSSLTKKCIGPGLDFKLGSRGALGPDLEFKLSSGSALGPDLGVVAPQRPGPKPAASHCFSSFATKILPDVAPKLPSPKSAWEPQPADKTPPEAEPTVLPTKLFQSWLPSSLARKPAREPPFQ